MSADSQGWADLQNGDLLKAAEDAGFEVMVTADQSIAYQQNLTRRRLALVVLNTNHWPTLRLDADRVASAINAASAGNFIVVEFGPRPLF
ncbi:MAG TPA: hypothetical protein VGD64_15250 [Acidisarcina sp.]